MKVRLLNVRYSPNLGDGLLVECLETRCRAHLPGADVRSVDLAGRTDFGQGWNHRRRALRTLNWLPSPVRQCLAGAVLQAKIVHKLAAHYERHLEDSDAIVVGGGHLLSDVDLNFPLKLRAALRVAARHRIPVWVHACGVSTRWSPLGRAILRDVWRDVRLVDVAVRDAASKAAWDAHLAGVTGLTARIVRDPGFLTAGVYGAGAAAGSRRNHRVGLGVIGPEAIAHHGGPRVRTETLLAWFTELAQHLSRAGKKLTIVSNGSLEDEHFARLLERALGASPQDAPRVLLPRHSLPADLVATLAGLESLVAFRMHALIAAASLGVPTFALAWDRKVQTIMHSIGRAEHYYDVTAIPPAEIARVVLAAEAPRGPTLANEVRACERDIEQLCASIAAQMGHPQQRSRAELRT